ncbi:MAG TPA: c-type cytochrome [Thermoanaerobaculia bacterium]|jgi:mono/diheme cytochrome c family protein|nr:c-type cytochrome [Thermoanaerobaculia bacterium]
MKTLLKVLGFVLLAVFALAATGLTWLAMKKPAQRAAIAEKIEVTPQRIARGKYLVHHVSVCADCHSERTMAYGLPFKPGRGGVGGMVWNADMGFPGTLAASNLTPDPETGLGKWTDGEILRAMREGVNREGKALFPIMPYTHLRSLSDEDARSIVVYLRTLKPIRYEKPVKSLNMPLNFVEKFVPKPVDGPIATPHRSDHLAYGKYLTTIALCSECHTPRDDKDQPVAGRDFSGGWEMRTPHFRVVTANITPHPSTFVGRATKEEFIGRFHAFANFTAANAPPAPKGRNTLMPWISYSQMTDEDLGAIYDYLKTLPPVENNVNPFPDAG